MYPCLELKLLIALCRGISFVLRTHDISLDKNNSPGSPDKDAQLTGSCYRIGGFNSPK